MPTGYRCCFLHSWKMRRQRESERDRGEWKLKEEVAGGKTVKRDKRRVSDRRETSYWQGDFKESETLVLLKHILQRWYVNIPTCWISRVWMCSSWSFPLAWYRVSIGCWERCFEDWLTGCRSYSKFWWRLVVKKSRTFPLRSLFRSRWSYVALLFTFTLLAVHISLMICVQVLLWFPGLPG